MKTTVNVYAFRDAFKRMNRENQFSYEGLGILFDFLEDCERDCGEEYELDVIALCCDFAEQHYSDIAEAYGIELSPEDTEQEHIQQVKDFIETESILVGQLNDQCNLVYRQF
jgi:hypothetical protein